LRRLLESKKISETYVFDNLNERDKEMLNYVVKLTQTPSAMTQEDVDKLKSQGFDDRAIHDVCCIAAYFSFVNRMANGLGVELE